MCQDRRREEEPGGGEEHAPDVGVFGLEQDAG
jgi:hypothetical protein